jgi:dTDP-4-amino-4,6-dideoxygalactose transaminase
VRFEVDRIPVARPHMPDAKKVYKYLRRIDSTKIYSNFGPLTMELEGRLARHIGIDPSFIATVSNGTSGISGLISTAYRNQKVINCPSWTFTATPAAIIATGKRVNFTDVNLENWESEFIPNIPAVHVFPFGSSGQTNFDESPSNIPIVIDAAASFGSLSNLKLPSKGSWAVVISMHATKIFGSGEGGFVISNQANWISEFKRWSNFGFWGSRVSSSHGTNSKLSEYHAAVGLASLDDWDLTSKKYLKLMEMCAKISNENGIRTHPAMRFSDLSPYWIIELPTALHKIALKEILRQDGIEFRDWWSEGAHKMPAYDRSKPESFLQVTDFLSNVTIGLPCFVGMTESDFARIGNSLQKMKALD